MDNQFKNAFMELYPKEAMQENRFLGLLRF
jgi:hypothetical protein